MHYLRLSKGKRKPTMLEIAKSNSILAKTEKIVLQSHYGSDVI